MKTIAVTIDVDTEDVLEVLTWMKGERIENDRTQRWLSAYVNAQGEPKELLFLSMPPSLQWCVHEYEKRGADALRAVLADR